MRDSVRSSLEVQLWAVYHITVASRLLRFLRELNTCRSGRTSLCRSHPDFPPWVLYLCVPDREAAETEQGAKYVPQAAEFQVP